MNIKIFLATLVLLVFSAKGQVVLLNKQTNEMINKIEVDGLRSKDPDTLKLEVNDTVVYGSYCAKGMPAVYDALHSFHSRKSDKFGGYINTYINAGLASIRNKGHYSDIKQLLFQINPKTLTVYWFALIGPSLDGKCYVRVNSRGSAGGGIPAVQKQLPEMHSFYPTLYPVKFLEFNCNVKQYFDWNGNPLDSARRSVNIQQHFFKYEDRSVGKDISLQDYAIKYPYTIDGDDLPGVKRISAPANPKVKSKPSAKGTRTYKVKKGDTLSEIAQKYHSTVSKIKKANKLKSDLIRTGQVLKIPR